MLLKASKTLTAVTLVTMLWLVFAAVIAVLTALQPGGVMEFTTALRRVLRNTWRYWAILAALAYGLGWLCTLIASRAYEIQRPRGAQRGGNTNTLAGLAGIGTAASVLAYDAFDTEEPNFGIDVSSTVTHGGNGSSFHATGPAVNIDGTPMMSDGMTDIHGNAYGVTDSWNNEIDDYSVGMDWTTSSSDPFDFSTDMHSTD